MHRGQPRAGSLLVSMSTSHDRVRPVETDMTVILASRAPTLRIEGGTSRAGPISEAARCRKAAILQRDEGAEKVQGWKERHGRLEINGFACTSEVSMVVGDGASSGGLAA